MKSTRGRGTLGGHATLKNVHRSRPQVFPGGAMHEKLASTSKGMLHAEMHARAVQRQRFAAAAVAYMGLDEDKPL